MPPREYFLATLVDPKFFESLERYKFDPSDYVDYALQLVPNDWQRVRKGIFYHLAPPPGGAATAQGWKLHLSATPRDGLALLQRVLPILVRTGTPFKFLLDRPLLELSNGKNWSRATSGKFVTIYPKSRHEFTSLAEMLRHATDSLRGPYILSDRRVPESTVLYYRYGSFTLFTQLTITGERTPVYRDPNGQLVDDTRQPYFTLPPWASDPFGAAEEAEVSSLSLKQDRYRVLSSLGFRNSGGVYLAEDTTTQAPVVIKEARPHVYASPSHSSVELLEKEFRLLSLFSEFAIAPEPVDLFTDWEHTFLVQTHVEGRTLQAYTAGENPLIRTHPTTSQMTTFVRDMKAVFSHLARSLQILHEHDVVMGDLSPTNVILNPGKPTVTLIDFEAALQFGVDPPVRVATPSFAAPEQLHGGRPIPASDRYAFGVTLLAFMCPMTRAVHLKPSILEDLLSEFSVDLALPRALTDLIHDLIRENPAKRPEWPEIVAVLQS